jgi:(S)-3,5-dihydroxyphenylglycine transaminase
MPSSDRGGGSGEDRGVTLDLGDLHSSLSDPLLDSMNFLNGIVARYPDAISFAPGRPYDGLLDTAAISESLDAYTGYLAKERQFTKEQIARQLMQYGPTNGIIRDLMSRAVALDEGIDLPPEAFVITAGCQEGMLLVLRALFADPEDVLLVASPCYVGITGAARLLDLSVVPVLEGEYGIEPGAVIEAARQVRAEGRRPRALYLVPDFSNPSGVNLPTAARREILDAAKQEDLLVLEDNPYGFFHSYEGDPRPTMKSLDRDGRVVYLGSTAKSAFPGARIGYVIADQQVRHADGTTSLLADELSKIKSMTTVNTSPIAQAVIGGTLVRNGGRLRPAAEPAAEFYRANMTRLLTALDKHFPRREVRSAEVEVGAGAGVEVGAGIGAGVGARVGAGVGAGTEADAGGGEEVSWNRPEGGFFVVVTVPFAADIAALERAAGEFEVLWTPMSDFFVGAGGTHQLRLSCSAVPPELVDEGIRRLAEFIAAQIATAGIGAAAANTASAESMSAV